MKAKNNKVTKSAKSRLSDLTPRKDARGGKFAPTPPGSVAKSSDPAGHTPPYAPPAASTVRKQTALTMKA
jgi:hypothetical protein